MRLWSNVSLDVSAVSDGGSANGVSKRVCGTNAPFVASMESSSGDQPKEHRVMEQPVQPVQDAGPYGPTGPWTDYPSVRRSGIRSNRSIGPVRRQVASCTGSKHYYNCTIVVACRGPPWNGGNGGNCPSLVVFPPPIGGKRDRFWWACLVCVVLFPACLAKFPACLVKFPACLVKFPACFGQISSLLGRISRLFGRISTPLGRVSTPLGRISAPLGRISTLLGRICSSPNLKLAVLVLSEVGRALVSSPRIEEGCRVYPRIRRGDPSVFV